ncbi:MAG: DUF2878 family protein [Candidatus Micrarchaeota archaeon]|nr:DUF2878 family protein [Candidatus Micrarchaeota archaeon]
MPKTTTQTATAFAAVASLWPLLFVPLTLMAVLSFGHDGGNLLLGALFIYLFVRHADLKTRRLMIVLAVFSGLFETANVASGAYEYFGTLGSPLWISLGWAIMGWWVVHILPLARRVPFKAAYAVAAGAIVAAAYLNGTLSLTTPIALAGLYALSLAVTQPFAIYAFTALFAIVAEFSGTFSGVWGYFNFDGYPMPPDLAMLALVYPTVMAFSFWASGFEGHAENQGQAAPMPLKAKQAQVSAKRAAKKRN